MKNLLSLLFTVILIVISQPVKAQMSAVFGGSGESAWTLKVNDTVFTSVDTGWIESTGLHGSNNQNYIVGTLITGKYNNYAVFDLRGFANLVTSAVITINTASISNGPVTYSLFDTNASLGTLDADRAPGDAGGIALFADLASGNTYGSRVYSAADANQFRSISLNGSALADIQKAVGGQFALGGTLEPIATAVPEPSTWLLLMMGFGAVGFSLRQRNRRTLGVA